MARERRKMCHDISSYDQYSLHALLLMLAHIAKNGVASRGCGCHKREGGARSGALFEADFVDHKRVKAVAFTDRYIDLLSGQGLNHRGRKEEIARAERHIERSCYRFRSHGGWYDGLSASGTGKNNKGDGGKKFFH